jgi:hypothetical protein
MKIEIDDDFKDTIVQSALVEDYVNLTNDLKNHKSMHEEDVAAYRETVAAIEALGRWYFAWGEFDKEVKKARKKK